MYDLTAEWYDAVYRIAGKDYAAEAAVVGGLVRTRNPRAGTLLDVACGTGRHLEEFGRDFSVEGIDDSAEMVAIARRRLDAVDIHHADMRTFDLGRRFDAVVCLFSSIGYMTTGADLDAAVARMAAHLSPGGVLVVEGWLTPEGWEEGHVGTLAGRDGDRTVLRMDVSRRDGSRLRMTMEYLLGVPGRIDRVTEVHDFGLHSAQEYEDALKAAGLDDVVTRSGLLTRRGVYVGTQPGHG